VFRGILEIVLQDGFEFRDCSGIIMYSEYLHVGSGERQDSKIFFAGTNIFNLNTS